MKAFLAIITFFGVILGILASFVSIKADTITLKESTKYEKFITDDISIGVLWGKVNFKVVYLMDSYKWELGKEDQLTSGQNIDQVIKNTLPQVPNFHSSIGIIAVGAASQEGDRVREEIRADNRADAIVNSIRTMNNLGTRDIYKLNLGQYVSSDARTHEETANQRRVIVIGIMDKPANMPVDIIKQKLHMAFENSESLSLDISNYSKFELFKR